MDNLVDGGLQLQPLMSRSLATRTRDRGAVGMDRQTSYKVQTSAEVTELEEMLANTATTPHKAKLVYNM